MALNIKSAFTNKDIRNKVLFTLLAFLVYRVCVFITVPMINKAVFESIFDTNDGFILSYLDTFAGGALQQFSIVALGIGPYITASIVMQLLQMDISKTVKQWSEEGEQGKKKINQWTRYLAVFMSLVQALIITIGFERVAAGGGFLEVNVDNPIEDPLFVYFYFAFLMTAGTCFLLWLADQITMKGIGNGTSMIIVAGIVSTFPNMITTLYSEYLLNGAYFTFIVVLLVFLAIISGVVFFESVKREIPIQYANNQNTKGQANSNIPIKMNSAGVIPVIFAMTLLSIPLQVLAFTGLSESSPGVYAVLNMIFNYEEPVGFVVYVGLIFLFAFFYSFMQINPDKIAGDLKKSGAFIARVRPGEETSEYISKILFRTTLLGATYLSIISAIPIISTVIFDLPSTVQLGGTSLIIVVGVATETIKQISTSSNEKKYTGFLD